MTFHGAHNIERPGWWFIVGPIYLQWKDEPGQLWGIMFGHRLSIEWHA